MSDRPCDFGRAAGDYARHRSGFPEWFFERLASRGIDFAGCKALDPHPAPACLPEMARRGARVTGVDISPDMLEAARRGDAAEGISVRYVVAPAEATLEQGGAFDLVTAATCWHWFDRERAAREALRVLAPGGALVICSLDWLPLPGNLVEATEALIRRHNPSWSFHDGDGLKPSYVWDLRAAGFRRNECFAADCTIGYSRKWRGRVRASAGVAATLSAEKVAEFDADLARLLESAFSREPLAVDHCVFAAIGWKPISRTVNS
jgi:SAM-dependent methyltransferase